MIGQQEYTVWSGKPDIYGWEIYPKMYEKTKSLSTSSGEYLRSERRVCVCVFFKCNDECTASIFSVVSHFSEVGMKQEVPL